MLRPKTADPALVESLRDVVFRVSPFEWFGANSAYRWKDGIADPTAVCLQYAPDAWATVITAGNVGVMVTILVERLCARGGDSMTEWKRHLIAHSLNAALTKAGYAYAEVDAQRVEACLDAAVRLHLVFITDAERSGRTFVTLELYVRRARAAVAYACRGPADLIASGGGAGGASESHPALGSLSQDQRSGVRKILCDLEQHRLAILIGAGGTGKTHVVSVLGELLRGGECGKDLHAFLAPTNKAASVLAQKVGRQEGRIFGTIHSTIMSLREKECAVALLVVDEASMLGEEHMAMIAACPALAESKLLLVGDDLQLPPVPPGEVLRDLMAYFGCARLEVNHRATTSELSATLDSVRSGAPRLSEQDILHSRDDDERNCAVRDWDPSLVVAIRNREKNGYNICRVREHPIPPHLMRYDDFRKEDPHASFLRSFVPYVGLPLVFVSNNYKQEGAVRGRTGRVLSVENRRHVTQTVVALDALQAPRDEDERRGATTSTVMLSSPCWELGKDVAVGYAVTVHSAQSLGSDRVAVLMPPNADCPLLTLEMLYTALSRASGSFRIFTCGVTWDECSPRFLRRSRRRSTLLDFFLNRHFADSRAST